jgi:hypothetical protein
LNGINTQIPKGYKLVENKDSRKLTESYYDKLILESPKINSVQAILCPDYTVN